jgi:hypothetical protein
MKKPYQIEAQRAVKQLGEMAADGNPSVQMILPLAEMMGWLRQGVSELVRQAGLQLMDLMMQAEVEERVGKRGQQENRTANRWGSERGYCVVMGQKVSIQRPRVRTTVRLYAEVIGVPGLAPHDLRRTCAKLCRSAGGELEQIQLLLGHASIQTTEKYRGTKQNLVRAPNDAIQLTVQEDSKRDQTPNG